MRGLVPKPPSVERDRDMGLAQVIDVDEASASRLGRHAFHRGESRPVAVGIKPSAKLGAIEITVVLYPGECGI